MKRLFRHPKIILSVITAITLFFAFQLTDIKLSNDVLTFIPENNPQVVNFNRIKEQFGSDLVIDVALENRYGTIFDRDFLNFVKDLTGKFKDIPGVSDVQSLSSTDIITGTAEGMKVVPLMDNFTGSPESIRDMKEKLLSWDIYRGLLFSDDFTSTQIGITIDPDIETEKINDIYFTVKKYLKQDSTGGINWYIAGIPSITVLINSQMKQDLARLIPIVVLVVAGALLISFRKPGGVILPLLTVLISGIWTLGAMAMFGIKLSLMDSVIPVILVAVGSAYGIHIVSHYYDQVKASGGRISEEKHRKIVFDVLKRIGIPVILAGLTTLIGFGSLISSTVIPMKTFGIFTAVGVAVSLAVALVFIPSVLLARRKALDVPEEENGNGSRGADRIDRLYGIFHRYRWVIMVLAVAVAGTGIYGTTKIVKDNILIEYFKKGTEIRQADSFLRKKFNGTTTFDIIVTGEGKGSLTDPAVLTSMDDLTAYLEKKYPEVTSVLSFSDFVKKMNQSMNTGNPDTVQEEQESSDNTGNTDTGAFTSFFQPEEKPPGPSEPDISAAGTSGAPEKAAQEETDSLTYEALLETLNDAVIRSPGGRMSVNDLVKILNRKFNYKGASYYEIPSDPAKYSLDSREDLKNLISQYLLLYSGELDRWIDDSLEPSEAKMLVQLNTPGTILPHRIAVDAREYASKHFPPGYSVQTVGNSNIMYLLTQLITASQTRSIIISLFLVFLILSINYRSIFAGIIGTVPVAFTVLLNFGVMGLFGIRLDMSTAMVSAVSIGIGIDYTIHYLSYYRFERLKTDNLREVELNTLKGAGKAIIFNAVSVAGGFLVLLLSKFTPLNYFGLLVAVTMIVSSTASLTILPILLEITKPGFISKERIK